MVHVGHMRSKSHGHFEGMNVFSMENEWEKERNVKGVVDVGHLMKGIEHEGHVRFKSHGHVEGMNVFSLENEFGERKKC